MKKNVILILFFISIKIFSQNFNEKKRYIVGTFHTQNTTINGISFGAFPEFNNKKRFVRTNGIRLEIPGLGIGAIIVNGIVDTNEETDEIINGLNISSGTIGNVSYNGLTFGLFIQSGTEINGVAIAGIYNAMERLNGIQIGGFLNKSSYNNGIQIAIVNNISEYMKGIQIGIQNNVSQNMIGIQIGIFNKSNNTKGIQLGLWNINEKRKLPIINWNF
ncbi:hypothetical protein [uncultured Polaribacter sp.]|uniref:LA_2272 family surface repeat-containing protein n=1 Tax=uncultured Polaribacter sp. TaxID=174711 RepID=UPI002603E58F|nr:hypothetical protein [uncultured Polaribacter sp.]